MLTSTRKRIDKKRIFVFLFNFFGVKEILEHIGLSKNVITKITLEMMTIKLYYFYKRRNGKRRKNYFIRINKFFLRRRKAWMPKANNKK